MALEFRRGTYTQLQGITPASGEPIWTTDTHALYVGDGVTPGGRAVSGSGGGGTSTNTVTNFTVYETLTLGPYAAGGNTVNLAVTQDSNQKLLITDADVIINQALEVAGDFIVSSNGIQAFNSGDVIPVNDQMRIIGQGTDIVDFLNSGTFFYVPVTATTATIDNLFIGTNTQNFAELFSFNEDGALNMTAPGSVNITSGNSQVYINPELVTDNIASNGGRTFTLQGGADVNLVATTSMTITGATIMLNGPVTASTATVNRIVFSDSTVQTTAYTGGGGSASTSSLNISTTWGPTSAQLLEASSFGAYGTATVFRIYNPGGSTFGNIGLVHSSGAYSNQPVFTMVNPSGPVVFTANAASSGTYAFTTSGLKFPDSTYQTTAYTGPVSTSTLHNGSYAATLDGSGNFNANMFLAAEGNTGNSGYSFQNDGGFDTGMFSTGDGVVQFFANNQEVFNFGASSLQLNKSLDANNQEIDRVNQITFNDTSVQNTAFTGDLRINGTWLKNVSDGEIYISPQDGNTGVEFPSDNNSGFQPVRLFNLNTGTVQINSNGQVWTFGNDGSLSLPNQVVLNSTSTKFLDIQANEIQMNADGQSTYTFRLTPGNSQLNTNQFQIFDEGANTEQLNITNSSATFTPPVVANAGLTIGNGSPGLTFGDSTVQTTAWTGSANIFTATTLVQSAQFQASNGASQTTGYSFYTETDQATGMYSTGDQDLEFYTDGHLVMQASTSSLNIALPILFADSTVQTTAYLGRSLFAQGKLSGNQTIPNGTDTTLQFQATNDPNGWINGSYQFKPTINGWYEITLTVLFDVDGTNTDTGQINAQIIANGTNQQLILQDQVNVNQPKTLSGTVVVLMNGSTDYVAFTVYTSAASGQNIIGNQGTYFTARLV